MSDILAQLTVKFGFDRVNGLLEGTHTIRPIGNKPHNKGAGHWQAFLKPLNVGEDGWHLEDISIGQRGSIYRAARSLGYEVSVHRAKVLLGWGNKGIVIMRTA